MVIGPGVNCNVTVILRAGELLPRHLNKPGILVVEEQVDRKWKILKTPSGFIIEERLQ